MTSSRLRRLGPDDLEACLTVAASRGWAREELKWRLLLEVGEGWGVVAGEGGQLAGTVVLTRYEPGLAVVGLLVVAPAHGGRGLGRLLMEHVMARGVGAQLVLYATPEGRPLYERLGFAEVGRVVKHEGRLAGRAIDVAAPPGVRLRPLEEADLPAAAALDARAFGAWRGPLLAALRARALAAVLAERDGAPVGFGIAWPNLDVAMVGPLVAREAPVARALAATLALEGAGPGGRVRLDLPPGSGLDAAELASWGLEPHPPAPAMTPGGRPLPGVRAWMHAIAAQALA